MTNIKNYIIATERDTFYIGVTIQFNLVFVSIVVDCLIAVSVVVIKSVVTFSQNLPALQEIVLTSLSTKSLEQGFRLFWFLGGIRGSVVSEAGLDGSDLFFVGKPETFLTCRAVAELFDIKIGARSAEEYALAWLYQTLAQADSLTHAEVYQFLNVLPELLARPFPICQKLKRLAQDVVIPSFCEALKELYDWEARADMLRIQKLLRLIK